MKKPPIKVYYATALKACRNHFIAGKFTRTPPVPSRPTTTTTTTTTLIGPPFLTKGRLMAAAAAGANSNDITSPPVSTAGNSPCLDLLYNVRLEDRTSPDKRPIYSPAYLKQLLPEAWSHSPLTTLKLIGNLLDSHAGRDDKEGFYTAAYWLYQHHPKTLASNLPSFATLGFIKDILEILYRTLEGENVRAKYQKSIYDRYPPFEEILRGIGGRMSSKKRRDKIAAMADKALQRYRLDPNYRFLHDGVSDLYAQCFKHDIQNLNTYHANDDHGNDDESQNKSFEVTWAAEYCPHFDSLYDRATLLCEGIARKVFPRASEEEGEEKDEDHYAQRVRERLKKEVLVPLGKVLDIHRRWGYETNFKREPCATQAYFEELKAGGSMSKIKADALLPNEIIGYVMDEDNKDHHDMLVAAELQWKTMVEDIYLAQGKFKNCLAVCDVSPICCKAPPEYVAFGLLVSELSQEPWNGKVITYNSVPEMVSIRGHDLKSKCEFMSKMDFGNWDSDVDIPKVFDLILQAAVNGKLKPEQMIKRLFVFTSNDFYQYSPDKWETSDYEAIQTKFKEKGYGDVVPRIVYWTMSASQSSTVVPCTKPGVMILDGFFSNNLVKSFLDNDGDMSPEHVMEAAISGEKYQDLVVVD